MSPALIAALPFLGALLPGLLIRSGRNVAASACGTASLLALIGLGGLSYFAFGTLTGAFSLAELKSRLRRSA